MKKILLFLTVCFIVARCMAVQVLWVGVYPEAKIYKGSQVYSWAEFANAIGQDKENIGARIIVDGEEMPLGYDSDGPIPAGQVAPTIIYDHQVYGMTFEFMIWMVDDESDEVIDNMYSDWQPTILLDKTLEDDELTAVIFEIGYWDENDDWNFIPVAYSDSVTLGSLWDGNTYTSGSLAPPIQVPWRPTDFYMPVPEPSTAILISLGLAALLARRKTF